MTCLRATEPRHLVGACSLDFIRNGQKSNTKEQSLKYLSCCCSSPPVPEPAEGLRHLPLSTGTSCTGFWSKEQFDGSWCFRHAAEHLAQGSHGVSGVLSKGTNPRSKQHSATSTLPNSISASITLFHRANCPYIAPEEVNLRPVREQTLHGQEGGASSREPLVGKGRMGTWAAATLMSTIQAHHEHNPYAIKQGLHTPWGKQGAPLSPHHSARPPMAQPHTSTIRQKQK